MYSTSGTPTRCQAAQFFYAPGLRYLCGKLGICSNNDLYEDEYPSDRNYEDRANDHDYESDPYPERNRSHRDRDDPKYDHSRSRQDRYGSDRDQYEEKGRSGRDQDRYKSDRERYDDRGQKDEHDASSRYSNRSPTNRLGSYSSEVRKFHGILY